MERALNLVMALWRTVSRGRSTAFGIAAAIALTSWGATRTPQRASMTSGIPPRAKATTGVPHDAASAATRQYGSSHSGVTRAAAAPPTSDASRSWSTCPA